MDYNLFHKKSSGGIVKNKHISNKELAEALHKPIIKKFKKVKVNSSFIDSVLGADLADKFNKGFKFLLCVIHIHSKYAWVMK